ncbi:metalloprotease [Paramyrothecium foliicola]|nr:metalloprotease [Paramyrothecium foliicola]
MAIMDSRVTSEYKEDAEDPSATLVLSVGLVPSRFAVFAIMKSIFALAFLATTVVAVRRCGSENPSAQHIAISKAFAEQEAAFSLQSDGNYSIQATVPTYFHIVATSTRPADGYLSDATVQSQLRVLNENYAGSGFTFSLAGVDRTVNANWARNGDELGMKRALRKGNYGALNLYFLTSIPYLGVCTFPTTATPGSTTYIRDGCTVLSSTVPGGSETGYNLGKTATHEVGHWLGLYHTFQGGCTSTNDQVADTPAQGGPTSGCPRGADTCSLPGICYERFTPGQITRMTSFYNNYRTRN